MMSQMPEDLMLCYTPPNNFVAFMYIPTINTLRESLVPLCNHSNFDLSKRYVEKSRFSLLQNGK